jgi:hypothetical protein
VDESTGRSMSLRFSNAAPALTRATGAARSRRASVPQRPRSTSTPSRAWPPASRPLGELAPQTHCRESTLDAIRHVQMGPMLRWVVVERRQHVGVVDDLRGGLRELRAVVSFERSDRSPRLVGVDFGSAARTFACLWNQQRCSFVCGKTSRSASQKPSAPPPTARIGARIPRRQQSRSRSATTRATRGTHRPARRAVSGV